MNRELAALYADLRDIIEPFEWLPLCADIGAAIDSQRTAAVIQAVNAAIKSPEMRMPLVRQYLVQWGREFNQYNRERGIALKKAA